MSACFDTVIVVSVRLMDLCSLSCYAFMHLVIMYFLLVLFLYDMLGNSTCWCWSCSSVHDYRLLPITVNMHVPLHLAGYMLT